MDSFPITLRHIYNFLLGGEKMKKHGGNNHEISFDSKYYEFVSAYLNTRSISRKHILIAVKAKPFPTRTITKMYFMCSLEKGKNVSSLTWKSYLSPVETIVVCFFLLMCVGAWIVSITKQTQPISSTTIFLMIISFFAIVVVFYYYCLYRYCNKWFANDVTARIEHCEIGDGTL